MIQISVNDQTKYISQLPHDTFTEILNQLLVTVTDDELVNEALNSRVCDLEDTIEIYYTK